MQNRKGYQMAKKATPHPGNLTIEKESVMVIMLSPFNSARDKLLRGIGPASGVLLGGRLIL